MHSIKNGEKKIKCVICKRNDVGGLDWTDGSHTPAKDLVVCFGCRGTNRPGCIPDDQYPRYWKAFSKKWRKENKE